MQILGLNKLEAYANKNSKARKPLLAWVTSTKNATWKTPQDIKKEHAGASFLSNNRVIFNIGGNNYA